MFKQVIFVLTLLLCAQGAYAKLSDETVPGSTKVDAPAVGDLMKGYTNKAGKKVREVLFIDTRKRSDLEQGGTIPGAAHLNIKKSDEFNATNIINHPRFVSDVLVFCNGHSCLRAMRATKKLVAWKKSGVDAGRLGTIYYFRDGFPSYRDFVYPDNSKNPVVKPY